MLTTGIDVRFVPLTDISARQVISHWMTPPPMISQRTAQPEMVKALHTALDARRQGIVISEFDVGAVKWVGILLQGLCTLVAIAMIYTDNRRACAITLMLFATGVALSVLLIAAYSRPFHAGGIL